MNKQKSTILVGAVVLGLSGAAFAGEEGQKTAAQTAQPTEQTDVTTQSTHGDTVSSFAREQARQRQDADMAPPESPPGAAVSQVAQGQRDWSRLDTDGDGILSDLELQADADLVANLDTYDTDGDGSLSRAEFDASLGATASSDFDEDFE